MAECRRPDFGDVPTSEAHSPPTYPLAQRKCTLPNFSPPFASEPYPCSFYIMVNVFGRKSYPAGARVSP